MDFIKYSPTWVEWALTAAGIAIFGIFMMLVSKLAPVVSISEMQESENQLKSKENQND
jgi:molybdopterin-containing oxidoreductase family membrane subunit